MTRARIREGDVPLPPLRRGDVPDPLPPLRGGDVPDPLPPLRGEDVPLPDPLPLLRGGDVPLLDPLPLLRNEARSRRKIRSEANVLPPPLPKVRETNEGPGMM